MKKNKVIKRVVSITLLLVILTVVPNSVNADTGEKPSITINIENLNTNNYVIDLLEYAEETKDYYPDGNYSNNGRMINKDKEGYIDENGITVYFDEIAQARNITAKQAEQLYNINYDNWISSCTRNSLLWGDCSGNINHSHFFNYFGTPDVYKILIINYDTGEIKKSNKIERKDFQSIVNIDYNTLDVNQQRELDLLRVAIALSITIIVEVVIALFMKLKKNIKDIVWVNLLTNLILQFLLYTITLSNFLLEFIILEIIVILSEYFIYKTVFKNQENKNILLYSIIANSITAILTFIIK